MDNLTAKNIMTGGVLEARDDWSLHRLAEFLVQNSISGAPVISAVGRLLGVVSLSDIICHETLPEKELQSYGPHEYYLQTLEYHYAQEEIASFHFGGEPQITVRDIMTPMIFKVNENTKIGHVADIMIKNRIHRIFVTHKEKVVGVISAVDMLKIIRDS